MPFVSFCVKCYNQASLIGEALAGAFEQTYPNMEIVISDDASTDGSVDVIRKIVADYRARDGRFPVTIIENKTNLGNGGNWQKLCSVAKGEWLVKADGDDRSLPTRVEELMKCWIAGGRKATALGSDAFLIDMESRSLGPVRRIVLRTNRPAGCIAAYHRSTYDRFGDFEVSNAGDDCVYAPRAALLGGGGGYVDYVDKPLVLYRVGAGFCRSVRNFRATRVKTFAASKLWVEQCFKDLEYFKDNLSCDEYDAKKKDLERWVTEIDRNVEYWGGTWRQRKRLISLRPFRSLLSASGVFKLALLLPDGLCDMMLDTISLLHNFRLRIKYGQKLKGDDLDGFKIAEILEKSIR